MLARTATLVACLSCVSAAALAQKTQIKALLKRAATEYRVGNFKEALSTYKHALALESRPSTILNIAQCHRQLGEREKALFFYKLYLTEWERANPDTPAPYLEEVQAFIKRLRAELEQEKRARDAARPSTKAVTPAASVPHIVAPVPVREPQAPRRPFYKRWWFWTGVGVVVAGAVTAGAIAGTRGSLPRYTPDNY